MLQGLYNVQIMGYRIEGRVILLDQSSRRSGDSHPMLATHFRIDEMLKLMC